MIYDDTGRRVEILDGRYLVSSTSNNIYYASNKKITMAPIIMTSSGGSERCFIIELQGRLLASNFGTIERVGEFQQFYVKKI